MEVSLLPQPIPYDFNDPIALRQQLEHLQEGLYSRRLFAFILEEMQQLLNSIAVDPTLLQIREELYERVPQTDFVKNTLEQLGALHFEYLDVCKDLEDLVKMVEEAEMKLDELKNYKEKRCWFLRYFSLSRRGTEKLKRAHDLFTFLGQCCQKKRKISQVQTNISAAFRQFFNISEHIYQEDLERGILLGDIEDIDGMLIKCVLEFNVIPVALTITKSLRESRNNRRDDCLFKILSINQSCKKLSDDDVARYKRDEYIAGMLHSAISFCCGALLATMVFRKLIPMK